MMSLEDKVKGTIKEAHAIYKTIFPLVERLEFEEGHKIGDERCWIYAHFAKKAFEHLGYKIQIASGGFVTEQEESEESEESEEKSVIRKLDCLAQYIDLANQQEENLNRKNLVKFEGFLPHHWIKLKIDDHWYAVDLLLSYEETRNELIIKPVCTFIHIGQKRKSYHPYDENLEGFPILKQKEFIDKYFGSSKWNYNQFVQELLDNLGEVLENE